MMMGCATWMPTSNQGLSDVIIGTILLNFSQSFLGDLSGKISNAGQGSIRKSLVNKLTHHVLSQDLEQCERNQRGGSRSRRSNRRRDLDPAKVLGHVKEHRNWDHSVGAMLNIPQEIFSQITRFLTEAMLIWNQSKALLAVAIISIFVEKYVMKGLQKLKDKCTKLAGFDRIEFDGWQKNYDLTRTLYNFEDMRINAKENEIEENLAIVQEKSEMEEICSNFFNTFFGPICTLAGSITSLVCAYLGGRLAQNGDISSSDLASFSWSAVSLLNQFNALRLTFWRLYNMKDRRFKPGFEIMDLLCQKPKIGIDGGYQPTKDEKLEAQKKMKCIAKTVAKEEKSGPTTMNNGIQKRFALTSLLKGDIEFRNVSFKYRGMQKNMLKNASFSIQAGSFVGICGERGAGKSTMFKLIMRLYDSTKGEIFIGGHSINYYNPV